MEKSNTPSSSLGTKVLSWIKKELRFLGKIGKSFLNVGESDGAKRVTVRVFDTAFRRAVYFVLDYGLAALAAAIVVGVKILGGTYLVAALALWVYGFIVAGAFILFYEKTGKDLSLGEDFRRAVDTLRDRAPQVARFATLLVAAEAIVWSGPEKIIMFYRKELRSSGRIITALGGLSLVQSIFWAIVYSLGYEAVLTLF